MPIRKLPARSMPKRARRFVLLVLLGVCLQGGTAGLLSGAEREPEVPSDEARQFEEEVRPILVRHCYECHSAEADEIGGELLLDSRPGWAEGGSRGPAIVPGDAKRSLLMQAIHWDDFDLQMPPDEKLSARDIATLAAWIQRGAPDPREEKTADGYKDVFDIEQRMANHWAWQPMVQAEIPDHENSNWVRQPLDAFILRRLTESGLEPAPPADRATWLRRVTFDLTGLPPTPSEIERYLADKSTEADQRVVDELLARDSFGENWGQHWLDLVRYAETKGHEGDFGIAHAWRYRDYVIRAFNHDVAYDDFVREHIAGDLLPNPRTDPDTRTNQSIQGTGYWYLGEATHSPVDIRGEEADRVANQIDVFGKTFLGLTIACARCHDHKFDAISTADYYALFGFIQSSGYQLANVADPEAIENARQSIERLQQRQQQSLIELYQVAVTDRLAALEPRLLAAARQLRNGLPPSPKQNDQQQKPVAESSTLPLARELDRAKSRVDHPLHSLARVAIEPRITLDELHSSLDQRLADHARNLASQTVMTTRREGELKRIPEPSAFSPERHVIVDFTRGTSEKHPELWLTSGSRFGSAPMPATSVVMRPDASHALAQIVDARAAIGHRYGHAFTGIYRTPTFEVVGDTIWYRFRGKAQVFAAVDSHRTVYGPLHGGVRKSIESDEDTWVGHRVDTYLGHRIHIEFQPEGDFTLYAVQFGEHEPPPPTLLVNYLKLSSEGDTVSLPEVASATIASLKSAVKRWSENVHQSSVADLHLVDWLVRNERLLVDETKRFAQSPAIAAYRAACERYASAAREIESSIPKPVWATAMLDGSAENEPIHVRGSHRRLAPNATPRGMLTAMGGTIESVRGSGRLELAERIVSPDNPLTARVAINRIWHHLLGQGLVAAVDNFGKLGTEPSHPELLDYLALELIEDEWNLKRAIRRIVLSSTYRMSSNASPDAVAIDPTNTQLHSARLRRLTAEQVRDAILFVSGELKAKRFGPSVQIHITDFMRHNRSPSQSGPIDGDGRRSIYVEVRRNAPSHFLAAFDKPVPFTTVGRRAVSNSAAQPLILLNDPLVHDQAHQWAKRLVNQHADDHPAAIRMAYLQAFGRPENRAERERITHFLQTQLGPSDRDACQTSNDPNVKNEVASERLIEAWTEVCLTLYNVKEFVFLP